MSPLWEKFSQCLQRVAGGSQGNGKSAPPADVHKGQDRRGIVQRFAYSGYGHPFWRKAPVDGGVQLQSHLSGTQIAQETPGSGGAERASQRTAGLAGDTQGSAAVENRLNGQAVDKRDGEFQVSIEIFNGGFFQGLRVRESPL
jgi:hypothetical protein